MTERPCPACGGARLRPEALVGQDRGPVHRRRRALPDQGGAAVLRHARARPSARWRSPAACSRRSASASASSRTSGLDYLTLDRPPATLSGGEGQRIRLATQIGSSLIGVLYILDEPSIGLHQRDNGRLLDTLKRLRDLGNTVLVVEHDEETIRAADYVVDLGPGAGELGGHVVALGHARRDHGQSRTRSPASYLSGARAHRRSRRRGGTANGKIAHHPRRRASTT